MKIEDGAVLILREQIIPFKIKFGKKRVL